MHVVPYLRQLDVNRTSHVRVHLLLRFNYVKVHFLLHFSYDSICFMMHGHASKDPIMHNFQHIHPSTTM